MRTRSTSSPSRNCTTRRPRQSNASAGGVQTEFTGQLALLEKNDPSSELIGIAVAIIVLLIAFGSVVAMGLPIVTALMSLFVGAAGVGVLSAFMDVPEFSLILCMMVGLGVGIDYALFIVTRHRQHLHEGMSVEDSAGTANATAGQAVLFAGTTVVIAILGLFLAGLPAMTSMGVSVALDRGGRDGGRDHVAAGLLGLAGTKIDKLSIHRKSHVAKPAHDTFAGRWAHHVGSHPVRYALVGLVALCAIATPALGMRIGTPDDGNAATDTTQRKAYDLLADGFGAGFNGPIQVVMEVPTPADRVAVDRVRDALQADPGVAAVTAPVFNAAGDTAVLMVNPTTAPQDERTDALVHHLRSDVLPATVPGTDATALLTGQAMVTDLTERITNRLPLFIAAIVAMSFVLLMIVFRSILVPLKAALMNLLSIAAAYGVIVAVFQWGWGNELIGMHHTMPINPFAPLMMFAILFGLSMDYEVFLLSRIREEYVATGDSHTVRGRRPVQHGQGDHLGGADHDERVRLLRARRRSDRQAVRYRPRRRRVPRRHARSHGARAGDDEPARSGQLVAAGMDGPDPSAHRLRVGTQGRRGHRHRGRG